MIIDDARRGCPPVLRWPAIARGIYGRWKLILTCMCVAMTSPSSRAGWYVQPRTALRAACCRSGGPEITLADAHAAVGVYQGVHHDIALDSLLSVGLRRVGWRSRSDQFGLLDLGRRWQRRRAGRQERPDRCSDSGTHQQIAAEEARASARRQERRAAVQRVMLGSLSGSRDEMAWPWR